MLLCVFPLIMTLMNTIFKIISCLYHSFLAEGALPRGALYMGTKETVDGDVKHTDTYYMTPGEKTTTTTTIEKKAPRVSGVGPRDNDTGMPVSLRMVRMINLFPRPS